MTEKKTKKAVEKKTTKKLSAKEIEDLVVKLAKKETPLSKIGHILKKEYGVPKVKYETGKIRKILIKQKLVQFPEEMTNLIQRASQLRKHLVKNHKDQTAKRGLQLTEAKVRSLAKYFKKKGVLEKNWTYTPK